MSVLICIVGSHAVTVSSPVQIVRSESLTTREFNAAIVSELRRCKPERIIVVDATCQDVDLVNDIWTRPHLLYPTVTSAEPTVVLLSIQKFVQSRGFPYMVPECDLVAGFMFRLNRMGEFCYGPSTRTVPCSLYGGFNWEL